MKRLVIACVLLAGLSASPVRSDPGVDVRYENFLLRVTLNGSYAGQYYQVWRSGEFLGPYQTANSQLALCTGDCFLTDLDARPGETYYYRFTMQSREGAIVEYGPYAVTVPNPPVGVRIAPNPSSDEATVVLSLPGHGRLDAPVAADARVLDLQGRTVRVLHQGTLPRGETTIRWDGRGEGGRALGAGVYFLRFQSALGNSLKRVVRIR
jgi:hypothetical protein